MSIIVTFGHINDSLGHPAQNLVVHGFQYRKQTQIKIIRIPNHIVFKVHNMSNTKMLFNSYTDIRQLPILILFMCIPEFIPSEHLIFRTQTNYRRGLEITYPQTQFLDLHWTITFLELLIFFYFLISVFLWVTHTKY